MRQVMRVKHALEVELGISDAAQSESVTPRFLKVR
jgi:hypothetical protein